MESTSLWANHYIKKNYKLIEELGKGSFGVVYKGKHRITGQKVAIKLIKNINTSSYMLRKILREITLLRKLTQIEANSFTTQILEVIIPGYEPKEQGSVNATTGGQNAEFD